MNIGADVVNADNFDFSQQAMSIISVKYLDGEQLDICLSIETVEDGTKTLGVSFRGPVYRPIDTNDLVGRRVSNPSDYSENKAEEAIHMTLAAVTEIIEKGAPWPMVHCILVRPAYQPDAGDKNNPCMIVDCTGKDYGGHHLHTIEIDLISGEPRDTAKSLVNGVPTSSLADIFTEKLKHIYLDAVNEALQNNNPYDLF